MPANVPVEGLDEEGQLALAPKASVDIALEEQATQVMTELQVA